MLQPSSRGQSLLFSPSSFLMLSYGNYQLLGLRALLFTSVILSNQRADRLPVGNHIDLSDGSDRGDQRLFRPCFTICCE